MVRILTGTLIEVGDGRKSPEEMPQILESPVVYAVGKRIVEIQNELNKEAMKI